MNFVRVPTWRWVAMLAAGPLGWVLHQQLSSALEHFDCRNSGPAYGVLAGLLIGGTVFACGIDAWRTRARVTGAMRFLAGVGALSAAMFLFAIALQTLAALIVPVCAP